MSFKQKILGRTKSLLSNLFRIIFTPLNIVFFCILHKKLKSDPDQRILWENRVEADFRINRELGNDPYYKKFDEFILGKLESFNVNTYLEIGCYYGYRLNKFSRRLTNKKFIGLDLGLNNLMFGKKKIIDISRVSLINANAVNLPFKDNSINVIYTSVSLSSISYLLIKNVIDEIVRVCSKRILLVEIDHRPMKLTRKLEVINCDYLYLHAYDKIIGPRVNLVSITPICDLHNHPRYTAFEFIK